MSDIDLAVSAQETSFLKLQGEGTSVKGQFGDVGREGGGYDVGGRFSVGTLDRSFVDDIRSVGWTKSTGLFAWSWWSGSQVECGAGVE